MSTLNLDDAQAHLREILAGLQPGDELVLTDYGQPQATLVKTGRTGGPGKAGSAQGAVPWMAPEFNATLEEFEE
jgi:antitoxin (DNA-binding transcriptional repressor) of toxin-antitoxin stability system